MNIKQLLTVVALAAGAVSAQANVATSVIGDTTTYTENFNGGSSFSGGFFNAGIDDYMRLSTLGTSSSNFGFTALSAVESLTVSFYYAAVSTAASWSLSGPSLGLGNTNAFSFAGTNPGAGGSADADAFVTHTWNNLAAGNYSLSFSSGLGALRVDDVSIAVTNVAAVPEPETYAMMLAGLMMMGAIARRRNKKQF